MQGSAGCAFTDWFTHFLLFRSGEGKGSQRFRLPPLAIVGVDDARRWFQFEFWGDIVCERDSKLVHMIGWAHPGMERARPF